MVTFHDAMPYSVAYESGQKQKKIMDEVMKRPGIENNWESLDFKAIVQKLAV
jgi:kynurenine 3-monooxygenase